MADSLYGRLDRREIPALNGLRAIAVFLVILFHFGFDAVPGGRGVTIFFVLSGFLITWLLLGEQARTGGISLRDFYRRRVLRIFPAFYVFWFGVVALQLVRGREVTWPHAWSAFFYVSNYFQALAPRPENGFSHTWSLAVEEQFYLLWPLVFLWCRGDLKRMSRVLIGLIAASAVYRLVLVYGFDVDERYIYQAFDTRSDNLLVGCLLAVLLKRRALSAFWRAATAHPALPLVTIALVTASVFYGEQYVFRYRDTVSFTLEPMLFALLIVQLIALSSTSFWSWLDAAPVRYLGLISYPLYLYQNVTLYPVRRWLSGEPIGVQLIGAIAVTVTIASCSYFIVERPFLQLKARRGAVEPLPRPAAIAS
jgi:peptidoglycan/LPS O-acetylase OafA/YrhL